MEKNDSTDLHIGKPSWLKTPIPRDPNFFHIKRHVKENNLVTVCEEAKCPNIGECWATKTATFMILGDTCTRACRFCHVKTGNPGGIVDTNEGERVAFSCQSLQLRYAVITMVDRDDLPDFGAQGVYNVLSIVKEKNPSMRIELLGGDFNNNDRALEVVLSSPLDVFAHNIETVRRLTPRVRDARAGYDKSLAVLAKAKQMSPKPILTKSALQLGLSETKEEIIEAMKDLRAAQVDYLTIGQYMRPTKKHLSVKEWVHPDVFNELADVARSLGFSAVASGPLVRSSYKASELYEKAIT